MQVIACMAHFNNAACDVGAVVSHTLQIRQHIRPDKAHFDGAAALLQTTDVAGTKLFLQRVDHFFERLHKSGSLDIVFEECLQRQIHRLAHSAHQQFQLLAGFVRKAETLVGDLFHRLHQIHRMVRDTLKVTDEMQQLCGFGAVLFAHGLGAELDEVGAEDILIVVSLVLLLADGLRHSGIVVGQLCDGRAHSTHRDACHGLGHFAAALDRKSGGVEQTLVQLTLLLLHLGIGHDAAGKLLQLAGQRQQKQGAGDVEHRVCHSDAHLIHRTAHKRHINEGFCRAEERKADRGTDHIEAQMHQCSTTGIAAGTHRGDHGGDTGTDVLTHDDGDGSSEGDAAGAGERLQNTDGSRGGLDDGGQQSTCQHTQNGVRKEGQNISERRHFLQTGNCIGHGVHTVHQCGEAEEDHTHILLAAALAEHTHGSADQRQNRSKRGRLEQLHEDAVTLDTGQAQDPRSRSGTDVRAHDHVDRLLEGHNAGVGKADDHDGGRRGGLDNGSHRKAGDEAHHLTGGHACQQTLQTAARTFFQILTHEIHTHEEQTQAANEIQYVKNIHT